MATLLIFTLPLPQVISALPKVLTAASSHALKKLYIHFDPSLHGPSPSKDVPLSFKSYVVSSIYSKSPCLCPNRDVHILLQGLKDIDRTFPHNFSHRISNVLVDFDHNEFHSVFERKYKSFLGQKPLFLMTENEASGMKFSAENVAGFSHGKIYNDVAIGGTFDRMHPGHKILLTEAVLRTTKRLTVGVSDLPLLKNKILKELIEPCSKRIENVQEFLSDIDDSLEYNIVEIEDPLGPTAWDAKIQMIVVSEETNRAVEMINSRRKESSLNPLDMHCIELFEDCTRSSQEEEVKFSSSSQRMRLLGTRYHDPMPYKNIPKTPYIIGLTGGSASGKSKLAARLADKGAGVVDCDKLGHKAYLKGTPCFKKIVETFGTEIVDKSGEIDRKTLGSIVFLDPDKLVVLNKLVWPEIGKLAMEEVKKFDLEGYKVVVLDAAVLLEAGWQNLCHEIWVSFVKEDEAITRIVERDGKTKEEATQRSQNQMSNQDRITYANIVFSTMWSYEYTQSQVDKAWQVLISEGRIDSSTRSNI